jgi:hypothetical protein
MLPYQSDGAKIGKYLLTASSVFVRSPLVMQIMRQPKLNAVRDTDSYRKPCWWSMQVMVHRCSGRWVAQFA